MGSWGLRLKSLDLGSASAAPGRDCLYHRACRSFLWLDFRVRLDDLGLLRVCVVNCEGVEFGGHG